MRLLDLTNYVRSSLSYYTLCQPGHAHVEAWVVAIVGLVVLALAALAGR